MLTQICDFHSISHIGNSQRYKAFEHPEKCLTQNEKSQKAYTSFFCLCGGFFFHLMVTEFNFSL